MRVMNGSCMLLKKITRRKPTLIKIREFVKEKEQYLIRDLMIVVNINLNCLRRFSVNIPPQLVLYEEEKLMERFMGWINEEFEIYAGLLKVYKSFFDDGASHFIGGMCHYYKTWQQIWLACCHQTLYSLFNPFECLNFETNMEYKTGYIRFLASYCCKNFITNFFQYHARDAIMLNENNLSGIRDDHKRNHIRRMRARELISSIIIPEDIQQTYGIETTWEMNMRKSESLHSAYLDFPLFTDFLSGKETHRDTSVLQLLLTHSIEDLNKQDFPRELQKAMDEQKSPPKPCSMLYNERVAAQYAYKEACDQFGIMKFNFCNKDLDPSQLKNVGPLVGKLSLAALYAQRYSLMKKRVAQVMNDVISMASNYYSDITRFRSTQHITLQSFLFNIDLRAFGPIFGKEEHNDDTYDSEFRKHCSRMYIFDRNIDFDHAESLYHDYDGAVSRVCSTSLLDSMTKVREPHNVRYLWMMQGQGISKDVYLNAVRHDEAEYRNMLEQKFLRGFNSCSHDRIPRIRRFSIRAPGIVAWKQYKDRKIKAVRERRRFGATGKSQLLDRTEDDLGILFPR